MSSAQMPLVVLTYPGHFLLTCITIKSFLRYNTSVPITVIVDDLSCYCWSEYVAHCEIFYKALAPSVSIVSVSQLPEAHVYAKNKQPANGWIRQQIIKLHLDKLIPYPVWFFTDGDVQFHFPVPHNSVPYSIINPNKNPADNIQSRQNLYVAKMLDIPTPGIITQHPHMDWAPECRAQVCVSNPPFRTMQASTLKQLRQHIQDTHGLDVLQTHLWLYNNLHTGDGDASFIESEFELIENFRTHVLQEDVQLIYYPTIPWEPDPKSTNRGNIEFCTTWYITDAQLGKSWFEQQNMFISDSLWQQLEQIRK
jgi:hypothetical protein